MSKTTATRWPFELTGKSVIMILSALERLKAAEQNNLALGPGSDSVIHEIERAEVELREQMPDDAAIQWRR